MLDSWWPLTLWPPHTSPTHIFHSQPILSVIQFSHSLSLCLSHYYPGQRPLNGWVGCSNTVDHSNVFSQRGWSVTALKHPGSIQHERKKTDEAEIAIIFSICWPQFTLSMLNNVVLLSPHSPEEWVYYYIPPSTIYIRFFFSFFMFYRERARSLQKKPSHCCESVQCKDIVMK